MSREINDKLTNVLHITFVYVSRIAVDGSKAAARVDKHMASIAAVDKAGALRTVTQYPTQLRAAFKLGGVDNETKACEV